jgi:hypothetical protein
MSRLTLLAGAFALGAAALLAWVLAAPVDAPPAAPARAPVPPEPTPAPPAAPTDAALAAALARPPFAPSRRPPAAASPVDAGPGALPSLLAVALGERRGAAILRLPDAERAVRVRPGERIGGFLLIEVARDRVVLLDDATEPHVVHLPATRPPPAETARATVP